MKKLLLSTAALLIATSAYAADIVRPVTPKPVDTWSWNGFYAGLSAGYGFGDTKNTASDGFNTITVDTSPSGFIGGVFVGHNWQYGNVVAGVESDMSWSAIKGSADLTGKIDTVPFAVRADNHLNWLGTTRARLGYAWNSLLVYSTGGLAYGGVSSDYTASIGSSSLNSSFARNYSTEATKVGWAAGMGLEYFMTRNLSLRTEWLYYDLGNSKDNLDGVDVTATHKGNVVRAGAAWKF